MTRRGDLEYILLNDKKHAVCLERQGRFCVLVLLTPMVSAIFMEQVWMFPGWLDHCFLQGAVSHPQGHWRLPGTGPLPKGERGCRG